MIIQKILIYCDMSGCFATITVEPTRERPLSLAQAINTARDAGWRIYGSHPDQRAKCPNHRRHERPGE